MINIPSVQKSLLSVINDSRLLITQDPTVGLHVE